MGQYGVTYSCLDIKICVDSSTPTEINLIPFDSGTALLALNIDASCVTRYDLVFFDQYSVLGFCLQHDTS